MQSGGNSRKTGYLVIRYRDKRKEVITSIKEVSECDKTTSRNNSFHHYITHLVLNPSNNRIAFLHRFFLADGGIRTRLMIDGNNLRCLAVGFLSHFDWKDDLNLFIWGRAGGAADQLRSNPILSNPLVSPFLKIAKNAARLIQKKVSNQLSMTFLLIEDKETPSIKPVAEGIITEDGHPMFNFVKRDIIVNDTDPDLTGERTLMLYNFDLNSRVNIGKFKMIDEKPDISQYSHFTKGVDSKILGLISPEQYSFTRSGLHCDLHPRWSADGSMIAFDSIHEGTRQLYWINVKELM